MEIVESYTGLFSPPPPGGREEEGGSLFTYTRGETRVGCSGLSPPPPPPLSPSKLKKCAEELFMRAQSIAIDLHTHPSRKRYRCGGEGLLLMMMLCMYIPYFLGTTWLVFLCISFPVRIQK